MGNNFLFGAGEEKRLRKIIEELKKSDYIKSLTLFDPDAIALEQQLTIGEPYMEGTGEDEGGVFLDGLIEKSQPAAVFRDEYLDLLLKDSSDILEVGIILLLVETYGFSWTLHNVNSSKDWFERNHNVFYDSFRIHQVCQKVAAEYRQEGAVERGEIVLTPAEFFIRYMGVPRQIIYHIQKETERKSRTAPECYAALAEFANQVRKITFFAYSTPLDETTVSLHKTFFLYDPSKIFLENFFSLGGNIGMRVSFGSNKLPNELTYLGNYLRS